MSIEPKDDFVEIAERRAQTIDDLGRARHMIAKGWCQGTAMKVTWLLGRTKRCATAAIGDACQAGLHDTDRAIMATTALHATLFRDAPPAPFEDKCADLVNWNDEPGRKKREVLALFDRAIARLDAGLD